MKNKTTKISHIMAVSLILLEAIIIISIFSFFPSAVFAGVGSPNVTVITQLDVGNVYPEILNVSIDDDAASVTLVANNTTLVSCVAVVRDYNGDGDINFTIMEFFNNSGSQWGDSDDNNYHYSNYSCHRNDSFVSYNGYNDDAYTSLFNCSFYVWYYADPGTWNCTAVVNDSVSWNDTGYDLITMSELLALGLPDTINYGTVNATEVSDENQTNVTNFGNVRVNLSLSGYSMYEGDNLAMNCTLGSLKNISIDYEKYNLTNSNPGTKNLTEFEVNYTNLTGSPVVKEYRLNYRQNDTVNEAINQSYWRIYVPIGVAGTCQGNIIFGATQAAGT